MFQGEGGFVLDLLVALSRHAKSRDHGTIGHRNIFKLRKDKGLFIVEFVEILTLNSMN